MKRNWNWAVWAGASLVFLGVISYPLFFVRFPALRDFPWANLPMIALGLVLIALGLVRRVLLSRSSVSNLLDPCVEYASPLLRRIIRNSLFSSLTRPQTPPLSLYDFMVDAIRMMNPDVFKSQFAVLRSGTLSEAVWSREFYRVATALLPEKCVISPEVRALSGAQIYYSGSLDYYVDGELQWLIELLVGGSKLGGHVKRFEVDGIYKTLPIKDAIVVDFQITPRKVQKRFKEKVMRVTLSPDFRTALIEYRGQETRIQMLGNHIKTLEDL